MKIFWSMLLAVCMVLCFNFEAAAVDASPEITITSLEVAETGYTEVIGQVLHAKKNAQITCLVATDDGISSGNLTSDTIIWINQTTVGNNGTFLEKFIINPKFSNKAVTFRFGSDTGAEPLSLNVILPELPPDIGCVANNSVIYGRDAYTADSIFLTPQNVIESIVSGGNVIYYKLGDSWYDLLNPAATSSAYLVESNAEREADMKKLVLRYYYNGNKKYSFATKYSLD